MSDQSGADAADHWREKTSAFPADGPKGNQLEDYAQNCGTENRREQRHDRPDMQQQHDFQADIIADHEHLAMREMNEPEYAENQ